MTPHRIAGKIQGAIWENLAVKRQRYYLAAFLIGAFGALLATLEHPEHGFQLWSFPVGGAFGVGAVWVLSFADRLQARINRRRGEGKSTWALQTVFVFLGLMALAVVVVLVAGLGAFFI